MKSLYWLIAAATLVVAGCSLQGEEGPAIGSQPEAPKTDKPKPEPDPNNRVVNLLFASAQLDFPKVFTPVSLDKAQAACEKMDMPPEYIALDMARMEALRENEDFHRIFFDSTDNRRSAWFEHWDYLPLDGYSGGLILGDIQKLMFKLETLTGVKSEKLEGNLRKGENARMVKVKYKLLHPDQTRYTTWYLVTTQQTTFMAVVNSLDEADDMEALMKSARMIKK